MIRYSKQIANNPFYSPTTSKFMKKISLLLLPCFGHFLSSNADAKLPNALNSNMVLRGHARPYLGLGGQGRKGNRLLCQQRKATTVGKNGEWMVKLTN